MEEGEALEQRVAASGKRVLRPTHFPCRCTYPRAPSPRALHPTQHRRSTPPCASLPPSRVPSYIYIHTHHLLPFVRHPTRLPFAHLRVTTPVSGNSRYKAIHRAYRAVDVIAVPLSLFVLPSSKKQRPGTESSNAKMIFRAGESALLERLSRPRGETRRSEDIGASS